LAAPELVAALRRIMREGNDAPALHWTLSPEKGRTAKHP
jgi:hypothetical protein